MQRKFELVDVVVAIGVFATMAAGGMFFLAANGTMSLSRSGEQVTELSSGKVDGMQWLQPVLGQAIVDQALLERRHAKGMSSAQARLTAVREEHRRWQHSPLGYLDSIKASAARAEDDHDVRVQAVMGRAIVTSTKRGVQNGVLSSAGAGAEYNGHLIDATKARGQRMDTQFLAEWQANLGRAIVTASRLDANVSALRQERLGAAIVQFSAAEFAQEGSRASMQERLGGATLVAMQTESKREISEPGLADRSVARAVAVQQPWPGFPMSTIVAASFVLMALFVAGLSVPPSVSVANPLPGHG